MRERGPVKDERKEVLTSADDGEEVRGWSDPNKEEDGGGCMGPDDGEEVGECLVSDPDTEEDGGCLDPDTEEDGGCLDPDTEEDGG